MSGCGTTAQVHEPGGRRGLQPGGRRFAATRHSAGAGLSSAEQAAEAVELYWKALARDVPFTQYDSDPITQAAAADMSKLSDFRGQKSGGKVTTATLFRGVTPGDVAGPYVSQFLLKPVAYGPQLIDQRVRTRRPASTISPTSLPGCRSRTDFNRAQTDQYTNTPDLRAHRPGSGELGS